MNMTLTTLMCAAAMMLSRPALAGDLPAALVEPYLQIHAALATDQMTGVSAAATAIERAAAGLGQQAATIVAGAKKLGAAADIVAARAAFGELSDAIIAYATATKSSLGKDMRVAYCPMVNKPWLQKDKELRNPYYGAAMLTCGSFKP